MPSSQTTATDDPSRRWHAIDSEEVLRLLDTQPDSGLTAAEATRRFEQAGPNQLPEAKRRSALARMWAQFNNPLIVVLIVAGLVTLLLQHYIDSAVIFAVVVINAAIGFFQEGKAESALNAVRAMLASRANVIRNGERKEIDAANLVPGDLVLLESGDRVPADLRLLRVRNLRVEESALTGESVPVDESASVVHQDASIGERTCMAYSGTLVVYGQGRGVVVATGVDTEVGKIGSMVGEAPTMSTPLTRRLDQFARQITVFILLVGLVVFLISWLWRGMDPANSFLAVVGLAIAAIPEGLPAIITIVLAIGTRKMAGNRAIVRRLPAVETLGSVSVICSDKTGTLTRNEMTVTRVMLPSHDVSVSGVGYDPAGGFTVNGRAMDAGADSELQALAECAALCNDAQLRHGDESGWQLVGDPTEGALLTLAHKAGLDCASLLTESPRVDGIPFESENRYMATLHHDHHGRAFVLVKGAPEQVLEMCGQSDSRRWTQRLETAAADGERVLALASGEVAAGTTSLDADQLPDSMQLLGKVGLVDPPRPEAVEAIAECKQAGIRVIMITGDHAVTAAAIGRQLGLHSDPALTGQAIEEMDDGELRDAINQNDVVARASPQHKMRLVQALQDSGNQVAMTGDGVNDAPALKTADIGVAMGDRGTDAAREASDIVLTDDNFATITGAVEQGRVVFDNIKKSLLFILPTNGGESGLILSALLFGLALPVTVGQILWVNMVTAVTLALALAFEPPEDGVMRQAPRPPKQSLITRPLLVRVAFVSLIMVMIALTIFEWEQARGSSLDLSRTAVVNMLVVGEVVYLFNVRHFTASSLTLKSFTGNRVVIWVILLLIGLQLAFTYAPPFQQVFATVALDATSWVAILALGILMFLAVEAEKAIMRRRGVVRL